MWRQWLVQNCTNTCCTYWHHNFHMIHIYIYISMWSTSTSHLLTKMTASPVTVSVGTSAKEDLSDLKQIRQSESPGRGTCTCSSTEKHLFFHCVKTLKQSATFKGSLLVPLVQLTLDHRWPSWTTIPRSGPSRWSSMLGFVTSSFKSPNL